MFTWHMAMSEPQPEDNWEGYTGFIHQVVYDIYLKTIRHRKTSSTTCALRVPVPGSKPSAIKHEHPTELLTRLSANDGLIGCLAN